MPSLIVPDARFRASFLAAMAEFRAEGRGGVADGSLEGDFLRAHPGAPPDEAAFAAYTTGLHRPDGQDPVNLWYVDGEEYLGRISIRSRLTSREQQVGGHIGYNVRPSARRRGHATAMLRAALPRANALGIDPALLTCDAANTASRRVIESCGGVPAGTCDGVLRFRVPTA